MGKENIRSEELKKNICLKTGHFEFDEVSDEDLEKVYELAIRGVKFNGENTDINIEELLELHNIKELSLATFKIDKRAVEVLKSLGLLELSVVNSEIEEDSELSFGDDFQSISIKGTEGIDKVKIKSPRILFISDSKVDFSKIDLSNAQRIYLQDCLIKGYADPSKNEHLEYINFDGSTIEDENGQIVTEFELRDGIYITHEDEVIKADTRERE